MPKREVTLIHEPTVIVLAETSLDINGLNELLDWVREYRPECVPDNLPFDSHDRALALFPHRGWETKTRLASEMDKKLGHTKPWESRRALSDAEMLVELAGRECYHSYGEKAGRKDNGEYLTRMINPGEGQIIHASVGYHPKFTFFIAGISRRVSQELLRHYVGSDKDMEGNPSQESTRYTWAPGHFVVPPKFQDDEVEEGWAMSRYDFFRAAMQEQYDTYNNYVDAEVEAYKRKHGEEPKMGERKKIMEAAAGLLPWNFATSLVWSANPMALRKMFKERAHPAADAEFYQLAVKWLAICKRRWPNLFQDLEVQK